MQLSGRQPAVVALAFAGGIALAPTLAAPASLVAVVALVIVVAAARWNGLTLAAIVAVGVARAIASHPEVASFEPPVHDRSITGVVEGPITDSERGSGGWLIDDSGDRVWLWTRESLVAGHRIAAHGRPFRDANGRSAMAVRSIDWLADDPTWTARLWRWADDARRTASRRLARAGGDRNGNAALRGIAFGDRSAIAPDLDARWRALGIYHVLSVSGLHLAIVALLCFRVLRRAIAASPWGGRVRPARWAGPAALVCAVGYTMITGAQIATLRALVVVAIAVVGSMTDRPLRLLDALAVAAIVLLGWRPEQLADPSFQLSFVAAGVLAVRGRAGDRTRFARWIVQPVTTSAWLALATAPITAYHFHEVAVGGVVGNVAFAPVLELIGLPGALLGAALDCEPLLAAAATVVGIVDRGVAALAVVVPVNRVAIGTPVAALLLTGLAVALAARRHPNRWLTPIGWAALCLGWWLARGAPPDELGVTYVDVGQGDAAVIELPGGGVWLIDAGGVPAARTRDAATRPGATIARLLTAHGHDRVDLAVISHPHPDHYLGLAALDVPVDELWLTAPPDASSDGDFSAIVGALVARGTHVVQPPLGVAARRGDAALVVWAPRSITRDGEPPVMAADPVRTVNDNSLVVELRYAGRRLVFLGDVEREGEDQLVAAGLSAVDVVKVAHHGSRTSSTAALVGATHPALAVISCGRANPFGFPDAAVVARWQAVGATIARTDRDRSVTILVDRSGNLTMDGATR